MAINLPNGLTDCLLWSEELQIGFHARDPINYDHYYFNKYRALDATPMGATLTQARIDLVERHFGDNGRQLIDIGIGGGRFVTMFDCWGYDVNREAVDWLEQMASFRDPYANGVDALTFWDSLEHIPDPESAVACARRWVFVSMPIYRNQQDCLASPHYKPGEHLHYWTFDGLARWFQRQGFEMYEANHMETEAGRRGIMSFAFRRVEQK